MASSPPPDLATKSVRPKRSKRGHAPRPTAIELVSEPEPGGGPGSVVRFRKRGANRWRFVRAYTTTFQVIFSYLSHFWLAKIFGRAYREQNIDSVHKRNAKRVYATILELQGLFIKVGQLLSIMANFLPSEFRSEL